MLTATVFSGGEQRIYVAPYGLLAAVVLFAPTSLSREGFSLELGGPGMFSLWLSVQLITVVLGISGFCSSVDERDNAVANIISEGATLVSHGLAWAGKPSNSARPSEYSLWLRLQGDGEGPLPRASPGNSVNTGELFTNKSGGDCVGGNRG